MLPASSFSLAGGRWSEHPAGSAAGGWLGRWRRLSKDYKELPAVSETMVTLAMIRIMLHRLVHPNRKQRPTPTF